jgi:hypothetical protein
VEALGRSRLGRNERSQLALLRYSGLSLWEQSLSEVIHMGRHYLNYLMRRNYDYK